jgi:ribosomal protein L29
MTQEISQLKEEIFSKDQQIIGEEENQKKFKRKNSQLSEDIKKITNNIQNSEKMIKTQEKDIARLKYVISEAEAEKLKQNKDYEMVINERDILGTQLIKR